ncbi:hypothetical protein [Streptomyces lonarensis]|uniref:Uncharacterized protein n=1 Tax=Streptomyces lonarensis TaxID=700599 RepID=A0A7X6HXY3_9ACTN|nr:hypothetical protein [Streptomyces lonarensis]NJQ05056.1 hypothetical protein [Streptomyces lonarensis]
MKHQKCLADCPFANDPTEGGAGSPAEPHPDDRTAQAPTLAELVTRSALLAAQIDAHLSRLEQR